MTNDELQALCNAATPGPWEAKNIPFKIDGESHDSWDVYFDRWQDGRWFDIADSYDEPTAKFVAAARTAIPELLAALAERDAAAVTKREALSGYAHEAWSGWMVYLFSKGTFNADGSWTMPAWAVQRWTRQMYTTYADLPETEKHSDRAEADKMLAILLGVG